MIFEDLVSVGENRFLLICDILELVLGWMGRKDGTG